MYVYICQVTLPSAVPSSDVRRNVLQQPANDREVSPGFCLCEQCIREYEKKPIK